MKIKNVIAVTALLCSSFAAHGGIVVESVTRNVKTGQETSPQTMWIQNAVARIESQQAQTKNVMIAKNESIYILEDAAKSYRVIDKATMEQAAKMMVDMMAKMREQMAKMPPDQRAMMEQMMKQNGMAMPGAAPQKPVAYAAQPTGGSETVSGRSCKLWNVTRDGVLAEQQCVVPTSTLPGADEVITLWKQMSAMFEKLVSPQMRAQMPEAFQLGESLAKIDGYPVMTRTYREGVLQPDELVMKTWQQLPIEAAKFEVPADYTKKEMPMPKAAR